MTTNHQVRRRSWIRLERESGLKTSKMISLFPTYRSEFLLRTPKTEAKQWLSRYLANGIASAHTWEVTCRDDADSKRMRRSMNERIDANESGVHRTMNEVKLYTTLRTNESLGRCDEKNSKNLEMQRERKIKTTLYLRVRRRTYKKCRAVTRRSLAIHSTGAESAPAYLPRSSKATHLAYQMRSEKIAKAIKFTELHTP
jgi:hypothetical protein